LKTPHFQKGSQYNIAVVFSCPGKEEQDNGFPASGKTGDNLKILLLYLFQNGFLKNELTKEELRITNSWDKVIYKAKDNRTEAYLSKNEIYSNENLERLKNELKDINDFIICFGSRAYKSVSKLNFGTKSPQIIESCHLGLQSLNRNKNLKTDINGESLFKGNQDNNKKRLEKVANEILSFANITYS
jgi:uracil-DNA glycosylase